MAQDNFYVVHLTDKDGTGYTINQPEEFLSIRAIERRQNQGIEIIEEDLPVSQEYIDAVVAAGLEVRYTSKWFNALLVKCTSSEANSIKTLPFVSNVEYVAPGSAGGRKEKRKKVKKINVSPENLLQNTLLDIDQMHEDGYKGEGLLIAVLDGGFTNVEKINAFTHLFDSERIVISYDFVGNTSDVYKYSDHGTKVLSLMAAVDDTQSYLGNVPDAAYMLFVTENVSYEYRIEEYNWLFAAEKADSAGVDILTTSLGYSYFDDPSMDYTKDELDGKTTVITKAAMKVADKGVLVVASAGNEGDSFWYTLTAPADLINGLAVGSVSPNLSISSFSSRGPSTDNRIKPNVVCLGETTVIIGQRGELMNGNGTSYAAPQIAGLAAGIWQANPSLTNKQVIESIQASASMSSNPNNEFGYGIPSYRAAKNYLSNDLVGDNIVVYPNPVNAGFLKIKVKNPDEDDKVSISVIDTSGRNVFTTSVDFTWRNNEFVLSLEPFPSGLYVVNLQSNNKLQKIKIINKN